MRLRGACLALVLIAACRQGPKPPEPGEEVYVVQDGDTLSEIADKYSTPMSVLARRNQLESIHSLSVGQTLIVPRVRFAPDPAMPRDADALPPLPKVDKAGDQPIAEKGQTKFPRAKEAGRAPLIWPVDGVVTTLFGRFEDTKNDGVEIGAPVGTVIWASAGGTVVFSGVQSGYGKLVIVLHEDGLVTLYAHNQRNLVKEGAKVRQGDPVALVGNKGGASSPGLHFEIRVDRKPINPLSRLPR